MTIEENGPKYAVVLLVDITLQLVFCAVQIGFAASFSAVLPACLPIAMVLACGVGYAGVKYRKLWMLGIFSSCSFAWFLFCLFLALLFGGVLPWDANSLQIGFGGYITQFFVSNDLASSSASYGNIVIYSLACFLSFVGAFVGPVVQAFYRRQDDDLLEANVEIDYSETVA